MRTSIYKVRSACLRYDMPGHPPVFWGPPLSEMAWLPMRGPTKPLASERGSLGMRAWRRDVVASDEVEDAGVCPTTVTAEWLATQKRITKEIEDSYPVEPDYSYYDELVVHTCPSAEGGIGLGEQQPARLRALAEALAANAVAHARPPWMHAGAERAADMTRKWAAEQMRKAGEERKHRRHVHSSDHSPRPYRRRAEDTIATSPAAVMPTATQLYRESVLQLAAVLAAGPADTSGTESSMKQQRHKASTAVSSIPNRSPRAGPRSVKDNSARGTYHPSTASPLPSSTTLASRRQDPTLQLFTREHTPCRTPREQSEDVTSERHALTATHDDPSQVGVAGAPELSNPALDAASAAERSPGLPVKPSAVGSVAASIARADGSVTLETGRRLVTFGPLLHSVRCGAIAPLRGSYVVRMWRAGERLQCRRDLPPEAFYTAAELESLLRACQLARRGESALQAFGSVCVALCYRWIKADHPDPDRWHLGLVGRMAHTYTQAVCKPLFADLAAAGLHVGHADFALFWDYASVHLDLTVPKVETPPPQPSTPVPHPSSPRYHLSPQSASARRLAAAAPAAHHTTSGTSAGSVATRDGRWLQLATQSDARVWVKRPQPPAEESAPAHTQDPIAEALRRHREDEAKRLSALWYGHEHTVCWVSPTLPMGTFLLDHDDEVWAPPTARSTPSTHHYSAERPSSSLLPL